MRRLSRWSLGMVAALIGAPAAAISLGQIDDFQNGTTQNWVGGASPINIATGGPAGSGDRYLQISAANGNLGTNNSLRWAGDYLAAGVVALRFELDNAGPDPVALRITLFGPEGADAFTSTNEIVLPAASGWVSAEFALTQAELTHKQGTGTLADTLAGVSRLLIRHDPDEISPPTQQNVVSATLGIDNITAVPEPGTGLLVAAGIAVLAAARRTALR